MLWRRETSAHMLAEWPWTHLPQSNIALAHQIPTYTANTFRLFQPVLYLRTFGLFMMFLTNKAFKFLISQISKSFLCVCLLALLSISLLGIFFFFFYFLFFGSLPRLFSFVWDEKSLFVHSLFLKRGFSPTSLLIEI